MCWIAILPSYTYFFHKLKRVKPQTTASFYINFVYFLQATYESHIIPSESAVLALVASHSELMMVRGKYSIGRSLTMLAYSAAKLLEIGSSKLAENTNLTKKTLDLIVPALVSIISKTIYQNNILCI